jgi:ABC-2 type transport system permease protein
MKLEYLLLFKQRHVWPMLLISMVLTWLSLQNGWQSIAHVQTEIAQSRAEAKARLLEQQAYFAQRGGAGEVGYYVFHNVYREPQAWSFIALGNRLVNPYIQRIRLLGLQSQLYDGESHHPEYVLLGTFDYAFWLVFCSPLLFIALLHGLVAAEHQAGRLNYLRSLAHAPRLLWAKRIVARWSIITASLVLPLILFSTLHGLQFAMTIHVVYITLIYTIFWAALCAFITLRVKASNAGVNAITMASAWLLLCVVLPNLGRFWIDQQHPVQDGSQIALQQRLQVHNAWDFPKSATLDAFYRLYPQWQNTPPVNVRFHWKWYYAFQHMADVKIQALVNQREQALLRRVSATRTLSCLLPPLWAQSRLEHIAQSDLQHLLAHRHQIEQYHTQLRHYFYPYLFEEKPFGIEAFSRIPVFPSAD